MNIGLEDTENMSSVTPYILAGLGNLNVDPNDATAYGVVGSILGVVGESSVKNLRFVVHGCGNVGSTVAKVLLEYGATVYTIDIDEKRADIPAAINISSDMAGFKNFAAKLPEHDVFVPCSQSRLIDEAFAKSLPQSVKLITGATNLPFTCDAAEDCFLQCSEQPGRIFVPEGISSAGAVILDSIEHYDREIFSDALPDHMYEFICGVVAAKTDAALQLAHKNNVSVSSVIPLLSKSDLYIAGSDYVIPIGGHFRYWLTAHLDETSKMMQLQESTLKNLKTALSNTTQNSHGRNVQNQQQQFVATSRAFSSHAASATSTDETGNDTCDVLIAGAGIMGLSAALQIKKTSPDLNVVVCEQAPSLGYGSSGWSTGFLRAYYSFDETMQLALDGISAYKNWGDFTGLGSEAEAYFTETGALWMLGKGSEENQAMKERLHAFGVESSVMAADDIHHVFPALSTDPYPSMDQDGNFITPDLGEFSAVYEKGCGHMDSSACLRDIAQACENVGVDIRMNCAVDKLLFQGAEDRVAGLRLRSGEDIEAGVVVNCLGPWFDKLNASGGVQTSTKMLPTRIQVAHKALPDDERFLSLPFVADGWGDSGIYFMPRRGNKQLVFGSVAHRFESEIVDPENYNTSLDPDVKQDYLSCLMHRLPDLPASGSVHGFSHMYTVNQDDVHPVIGPSSKYGNYFLCNGFSGHGFKLAPAVGSLLAMQILKQTLSGPYHTSTPLEFMGADRAPLQLQVKTHFA